MFSRNSDKEPVHIEREAQTLASAGSQRGKKVTEGKHLVNRIENADR